MRIAYTDEFVDVFNYFRAVLKANEISERALELSESAALLNPANYTVWFYRRLLIRELNEDLRDELSFITEVINENPKNYQVWQHRKCIVDAIGDASDELEFTRSILKKDSKNYHAWQYRQYIIKQYNMWNGELDYINELLKTDVKNNSAWNQRYFYFNNTADLSTDVNLIRKEIAFCQEKINLIVDNESVWNYVRGLFKQNSQCIDEFAKFCLQLNSTLKEDEKSPLLLAFLVYYYEEKMNASNKKQAEQEYFKNAMQLIDDLSIKHDVIRKKYWNFIKAKWNQKYQKLFHENKIK